jgi:hypothetical protein
VEAWVAKKTMRYYGYNKKKTPFLLLTYCGAPRGPSGADFAPDSPKVGLGHLSIAATVNGGPERRMCEGSLLEGGVIFTPSEDTLVLQ